ncbi:YicC/YloC family endoribonuclease [uncultured Veillonella sp.]|uniref:YicC/YloC family endoribonuclease n=1 Tax=uncultured Veillonella sp. TaxID=159268 RepID=UPI0025EF4FAD|nr:YicC/YloC family endoribonuclease [uncultured Veillonella sp.]
MKSMTGFGRGRVASNDVEIQVEIKSVNSRYLDIYLNMPAVLNEFETDLKQTIKNELNRGKVEVYISLKDNREREKSIVINRTLVNQIRQVLVDEGFYTSTDSIRLMDVMNISKDWLNVSEIPTDNSGLGLLAQEALKQALAGLVSMRQKEGALLKADIEARLSTMESLLHGIKENKDGLLRRYEERLQSKIEALVEKHAIHADSDRILQEVAILADKTDITEEIVRFGSHVVQLKDTLLETKPVGRKLDFLIQEMNREVNTMGSKGSDLDVIDRVVGLKYELEKVREQIQNLE